MNIKPNKSRLRYDFYRHTNMADSSHSESNGLHRIVNFEISFWFRTRDLIWIPWNIPLSRLSVLASGEVGGGIEVDDGFSNGLENEIRRWIS